MNWALIRVRKSSSLWNLNNADAMFSLFYGRNIAVHGVSWGQVNYYILIQFLRLFWKRFSHSFLAPIWLLGLSFFLSFFQKKCQCNMGMYFAISCSVWSWIAFCEIAFLMFCASNGGSPRTCWSVFASQPLQNSKFFFPVSLHLWPLPCLDHTLPSAWVLLLFQFRA